MLEADILCCMTIPKALLFLCISTDKSLHVFGQFEENLFAFCCRASFGNIARLKFFEGFCGRFADVSCRIVRHARSFKAHVSIATTDEPALPQVAWALKLLDTAQKEGASSAALLHVVDGFEDLCSCWFQHREVRTLDQSTAYVFKLQL